MRISNHATLAFKRGDDDHICARHKLQTQLASDRFDARPSGPSGAARRGVHHGLP
jgi:hypothetical protein